MGNKTKKIELINKKRQIQISQNKGVKGIYKK